MCFVPGVCFLCFLPLCLLQSCLCSPELYPGLDFCFCIFLYSLSVLSPAFNLLLHFVLQLMLSFCIGFLLAKTHNNITTVHVFFSEIRSYGDAPEGVWQAACVLVLRVRLLTRQRLTLLLLHLPLTVGVEGAAPAVGQSETLLLLPALTPGRVCHRLQKHTQKHRGNNISPVKLHRWRPLLQ